MTKGFIINREDNVVIVADEVKPGGEVQYFIGDDAVVLEAKDLIPIYHKIACRDIDKGQPVLKYGEVIGTASEFIPKGSHVHVHNIDE